MSDAPHGNGSIAVVYLLRRSNNIADLTRFLASYGAFPAGPPHDVIIVFKGFTGNDDRHAISHLDGIPFSRFDCPDEGYDIGPYLDVARHYDYDFFCFFNSFSVIGVAGWLAALHDALLSSARAGVVGATGSWEALDESTVFPNYHIRTNAFMITAPLFRGLETWAMEDKRDTSLFEAGPRGLTAQLLARGLEPYVVDRQGHAWAKEDWPRSNTYRAGNQDGLMVADRRTDAYLEGDAEIRRYLDKLAWVGGDPGPNPFKKAKLSRRLRHWLGW